MELLLVYRILVKISEWAINGYYSEIEVAGEDDVPKDDPLILYVVDSFEDLTFTNILIEPVPITTWLSTLWCSVSRPRGFNCSSGYMCPK